MPFYNHEERDQLKSVIACAAGINPVIKILTELTIYTEPPSKVQKIVFKDFAAITTCQL